LSNVPADAPMAVELYGAVFAPGERAFVIWPFFATQVPLVRPAFYPQFLDGFRYIAQSHGISGRFEADSANYPVEVAYYRWLGKHAPLLWSTTQTKASGPQIDVRLLPFPLSTRATRDSLFQALMPVPNHTTRLALWCLDMSTLFGRMGELDRAEEWARRGLLVDAKNMNGQLQIGHALSLMRLNRPVEAEQAARAAVTLQPSSFMAHFYYGLALRDIGRPDEGLAELRKAYAMSLDNRVRIQIGEFLVEMHRYEEAVREFEAVPVGIPERAEARRDLGIVYIQNLGRREEGIAALREAASLSQDPREVATIGAEIKRLTEGAPR
jgi:tetratricopeptide (TPR) repeat protein